MAENVIDIQARDGLGYGNRANNINLLRFIAAAAVLYFHMDFLLGKTGYEIMGQGLGSIAVNVFFLLSGYLIANSWAHSSSFLSYFIRRVVRIFPALIVVVMVTVFAIGPAFTTLSLEEYFSNPDTWKYLQCILLSRTGSLPGVFESVPYPSAVNGSLWTLRYEFAMYLLVPLVYVILDRAGSRREVAAFVMLGCSFAAHFLISGLGFPAPAIIKQGVRLAVYFLVGSFVYEFRLVKYFNEQYAVLALLAMLIFARESGLLCMPLMLAATTIFVFGFALAPQPKFAKCFSKNDFSYGIYIWAFPIGQILVQLGEGSSSDSTLAYSIVVFTISLVFAAGSWFLIEKPCMEWGKRLSKRF